MRGVWGWVLDPEDSERRCANQIPLEGPGPPDDVMLMLGVG